LAVRSMSAAWVTSRHPEGASAFSPPREDSLALVKMAVPGGKRAGPGESRLTAYGNGRKDGRHGPGLSADDRGDLRGPEGRVRPGQGGERSPGGAPPSRPSESRAASSYG
jgi:hypothetical protein